jgi:cytochrome b
MSLRILVWDLPTRVFHWSLAASFAVAFVTAESERYRDLHVVAGYLLLGLIGFRLIWGLIGSRHARFASFMRGPAAVIGYLRSLLTSKPEHHVGHNPAGAIAIVLLLALAALTGLTGWLTFNEIGGEAFEELHEGLAHAMLIVVVVHVLGVIVASRLHRENLARAMLTGYKRGPREQGIARGHGMIAVLLVAALGVFGWSIARGSLPSLLERNAAAADKAEGRAGKHHGQDG